MRTAAKVDANQAEIVSYLRDIPGCKVAITSMVGHGFPDIVVAWMGKNYMFEIKDSNQPLSKRKLTPAERKFHVQWEHAGQVDIVTCVENCWVIMGMTEEEIPF